MNAIKATETPRAWVGCLSCYNNGSLVGTWIDGWAANDLELAGLATVQTVGDYTAPRCTRCGGDEFWVMDHENYYGLIDGECSPAEAAEVAKLIDSIEAEGVDVAAAAAWLSYTGKNASEWGLDEFQDSFCGEYESFQSYAEELAEELYGKELSDARWPFSCIDWEKAARELSYDYHTEEAPGGGEYIFRA